jgi:hypothetical protein
MATYTLARLVAPQTLATTAGLLYQVPANTTAVVKQLLITNQSALAATITLNLVPSGSINTLSNEVLSTMPVAPSSTITFDLTQVLNAGDSIYGVASASSSINVMISGFTAA